MSVAYVLWRREMRTLFNVWSGYALIAAWLMASAWGVLLALRRGEGGFLPLAAFWAEAQAQWLPVLCTILTMRRFSSERASGTLETLLTAPVRDADVVMAKYAASLSLAGIGLILTLFGPMVVLPHLAPALSAGLPVAPFGVGWAVLMLQAALWCAVGIFFALLCRQQALAAAWTLLAVAVVPRMTESAARAWPGFAALSAAGLPPSQWAMEMTAGLFSPTPIVCHLAATACFLFLSVRLLESRRFCTR